MCILITKITITTIVSHIDANIAGPYCQLNCVS